MHAARQFAAVVLSCTALPPAMFGVIPLRHNAWHISGEKTISIVFSRNLLSLSLQSETDA
jgi:hypothetical protein